MTTDAPIFEQELYVPREIVFDLWTDPAHLQFWYAPAGATGQRFEIDGTESGKFDFSWTTQDGLAGAERGTITVLAKPARLVFVGECVLGNEPAEPFELEVVLQDHGGKTGIVVNTRAIGTVLRAHFVQVWPARMDALENYLSSI